MPPYSLGWFTTSLSRIQAHGRKLPSAVGFGPSRLSSLETAELTAQGFRDIGKGPGSTEGEFIDWLTMKDNAAGLVADVKRIRNHPLIPRSIPIYGYIYDVKTGKLEEVSAAMAAGKAT